MRVPPAAPVAVGSALDTLQLLRVNVYDVILMGSSQMPFLPGVDCFLRICAGKDGILGIKQTVTIVAVTACTSVVKARMRGERDASDEIRFREQELGARLETRLVLGC